MIMNMRKRATLIMFIVLVSFVALMVLGWGMDITGLRRNPLKGGGDNKTLAVVDKKKITITDFYPYLRRLIAQIGDNRWYRLRPYERDSLVEVAWGEAVSDVIWEQVLERERMTMGEAQAREIVENFPPQEFYQDSTFLVNGRFNIDLYHEMIRNPNILPERQYLLALYKAEIQRQVPRDEVSMDIRSGVRLTQPQVEEVRALYGTQMKLEALFIYKLPKIDTTVSETEILAYYEEHPKEFEHEDWWLLKTIRFFVLPSPGDTLALEERVQDAVAAMKAGYQFEQVSLDFTGDSSSLVARPTTSISPGEKGYLDTLSTGAIGSPYFYRGAWHIVQLVGRTKDTLTYREISFPLEASVESRRALLERIEEFHTQAQKAKLDSLVLDSLANAFGYGIRIKMGPFVRRSKDLVIPDFPYSQGVKTYAMSSKVGDISEPFPEVGGIFYLFATVQKGKARAVPVEEARDYIKARVVVKKREEAQRELAFKLREIIAKGADFASLVNNPAVNKDALLSISTLEFSSYFEAETRYDPMLAGACYTLDVDQMTGPIKCSVGYAFFRCLERKFDPTAKLIPDGIQNEANLILDDLSRELFLIKDIKDYRRLSNFEF